MSQIDRGLLLEPGEPDDPLHDEALRQALAQAPDRTALPDWRVRQAILDHAHEAISAAEELLTASRERAPWWRLAWWRNKVGMTGATPWNAALASLMVAVLVTLLWQREPVPGARLDSEPASAPAPSAKEEINARDEVAASRPEPAKPEPAKPETAAPAAHVAPAAPVASGVSPAPATSPARAAAPEKAERELHGNVDARLTPPKTDSFAAAPPPPPGVRAAPPVPTPESSAAEALADRRKSALATAPAPAPAPAAPPAAQFSPAPEAGKPAATGAARQAAPAAASPPAARSEIVPMPDFSSLSRWTELRVANVNGAVRVVPRAEAGDLGLLMSSAAIMAVGAPPLRSLPEWRVSLERRGQVLAVLEVARNDVRWTEGALPPATGTPSPEAQEALRQALNQAIRSGAPARPVAAPPPPAKAPAANSPPAGRPDAVRVPSAPPIGNVPLVPPAPAGSGASPAESPRAPE